MSSAQRHPEEPRDEPRHPIGVVARRTGLSPNLLRAWERRYGAIEPGRTDTRRRLYSDLDIARLGLMRQAVSAGRRISDVARLSLAELEALIREDREAGRLTLPGAGPGAGAAGAAGRGALSPAVLENPDLLLRECLAAVAELDRDRLERLLREGVVSLGRGRLRAEVLAPLMREIGERWQDGRLRIVHEHLASVVVRGVLADLPDHGALPPAAPRLLVTTPSGQLHEFGALLAAAAASDHGWEVAYLGPNLPAEEIVAAARRLQVSAVALSLVYPVDGPRVNQQLTELRRHLGPELPILVGGRAAGASRGVLLEIGAIVLDDPSELPEALDGLAIA